jgi:hypothetical protein
MQPGVGEDAAERFFGLWQILFAGHLRHLFTSLARLLGKMPYVQAAVMAAAPSVADLARLLDELAHRPAIFACQEYAQCHSPRTYGQAHSHACG